MKIHRYAIEQDVRGRRYGALIEKAGRFAEIAPLPGWSKETLDEACYAALRNTPIYPSTRFALDSLKRSFCAGAKVPVSALLMGTPQEIMQQADLRKKEGFFSAKLKVGHLSFQEARQLIDALKDLFFLRVDVNRAWDIKEAMAFFSIFPYGAFDYVEEPVRRPQDLIDFTVQPVAVDESFPIDLDGSDLEKIRHLKAIVYKPTLQGTVDRTVHWAKERGIGVVLSSAFESDVGLMHIASLAHTLFQNPLPLGIGTYHYLKEYMLLQPPSFNAGFMSIPSMIPKEVKWV